MPIVAKNGSAVAPRRSPRQAAKREQRREQPAAASKT